MKDSSHKFEMSGDHIRVFLKNIETEAHVGLHPWEKHPQRPARLIINIEMFAALAQGHTDHNQKSIVDYDLIRNEIKKWPSRPHSPLLETLVEELISKAFENPNVEACRVSVCKPDIFNEVDAAGVEIFRRR